MNEISTGRRIMRLRWLPLSRILVALLSFTAMSACQSGDTGARAIHGVVLEKGSNKPLAGAIVKVDWHGISQDFGGHGSGCFYVDTAVTDAQGRFVVPAWRFSEQRRKIGPVKFLNNAGEPRIYFRGYKETYELSGMRIRVDENGVGTYLMEPDMSTPAQRMELLHAYSHACSGAGPYQNSMRILYFALLDEGQGLATTKDHQTMLEGWRWLAHEYRN